MTLLSFVAIPLLVSAATPSLKLDGVKSNVEGWPVAKLQQEASASLVRSATHTDAGFTVVADPEATADVLVRGLVAPTKGGVGVRFTWALKTQGCPMLTDQVAWDFKSPQVSPIAFDAMSAKLVKRARALVDKAQVQHATSCIPIDGVGPRTVVTRPTPPPAPPQHLPPPQTFPTVGPLPAPRTRILAGPGGTASAIGGVPASNY